MADQNNPHFTQIFWYIIMTTILVMGYCIAVSFLNVPEKNMRVVDTITGFFFTVLGAGYGYLLGGNPAAMQHPQNQIGNVENLDSMSKPTDKQPEDTDTDKNK